MNTTGDRLRNYYSFSESIVATVNSMAEEHLGLSFDSFMAKYNVPEIRHFSPKHSKPIELIDVVPKAGYDNTIVYHEAMATSINANSIMHIMPLALALPTARVIGVGNPGQPGHGYGKLSLNDARAVWKGNRRATVAPTLEYLAREGLDESTHVGYSWGADKVLSAAEYAEAYDLTIAEGVEMETASVKKRTMPELGHAFNSADERLQGYVQATNSQPYFEARKKSDSMVGLVAALFRPTNIAISHSIALGEFEELATDAHERQPGLRSSIMWGSESELAIDGLMSGITARLKFQFGDRIQTTRFESQAHAMCDDIYFHTATILHGLEQLRS